MSQTGLLARRPGKRPSIGSSKATLGWLILLTAVVLAVIGLYLAANSGTPPALVAGDFSILVAALLAGASCSRAALRGGVNARAWAFMAAAAYVWAAGMAVYTFYGLAYNNVYPFPSLADALFLSYSVPAAVALFTFKRRSGSRVALFRTVMDAAVIAGSVLVVSWFTALGPVFSSGSGDLLTWLTNLGYPVVDVVITSLVLVLAMRRHGERLPWLCFGGGLLLLTVTDTIYVRLTFEGIFGVTGSPLALGWVSAFLLIAVAPLMPFEEKPGPDRKAYALALELLPYVPMMAAVALFAAPHVHELSPFLLVAGRATVVFILVRQVLIIIENITLTSGLEQQVAARTAELEGLGAIVNASADAILATTPEGIITSWNAGAERQYGYTAEEVIGRDGSFLLVPGNWDRDMEAFQQLAEGRGAIRHETEHLKKDGTAIPVSLTISPIRDAGQLRGIATIARDITQRRAAELELQAAREAALESSRLKSEFLATMSHEIRTPMNGVVGLTALLLATPLDETQKQYAQGVKGAGEALLGLINDILDFSKLEAGKVDLDVRPFDPRLLVEEVAGLLAEAAQAKQLELIAYCDPEVPALLSGDSGRIRQILLNLTSNAVKFTSSGEVSIRVRAEVQEDGSAIVRFDVSDTGIGIDPAHHSRLFESFSQADASTTRRYGGTGLGLAICRRLTEAMGGEIGLKSQLQEGSTFWFCIPLPVVTGSSAPAPAAGFLNGLRVLVVDDNATNRLVLESQLRGWRLRPEAVPDAQSALARAREAAAAGEPFDIAVLDLCMPDTDGLELARELKADAGLADIELIMLTSTMQVNPAEVSEAGVREWLMKPVRSSELYNRLVRLMSAHEPGATGMSGAKTPAAGSGSAALLPAAPAEPSAQAVPSRGRVLVVEDNEVNQLVARATVTKLGYAVDVVADGSEAVSATTTTQYAAILMDCHMPVMDGFDATRVIRSRDGKHSRLPIIAMTAGALYGDRERCLAAGMDDYLAKPVDAAELEAALTRWIPEPAAETSRPPSVDPDRLAILRELGPADGRGLLPATADAFRRDVPARLASLREAVNDGGGQALVRAAHVLKGAAANIGATAVAGLCQELEGIGRNGNHDDGPQLVSRLEAELALVDAELDEALAVAR
ncbi:two-component system sensor histidine kinase/response regulator [Arthrobacter pascens]|uniref:PAS domain-containing hybrid sensor histidine kinase/response regulator n=1 Tax=Arthrobacter pascens TaxID=1677 RepID=UPI002791BCAA|nr:response regulator [Arthrobacter pascens]MDQ0679607.1 two-component system sensor histidine kinase/response regulator [Arthrobacter pascens]